MHNSNIFVLTLVLCGICFSAQVIKMYIDRTTDTFNHTLTCFSNRFQQLVWFCLLFHLAAAVAALKNRKLNLRMDLNEYSDIFFQVVSIVTREKILKEKLGVTLFQDTKFTEIAIGFHLQEHHFGTVGENYQLVIRIPALIYLHKLFSFSHGAQDVNVSVFYFVCQGLGYHILTF